MYQCVPRQSLGTSAVRVPTGLAHGNEQFQTLTNAEFNTVPGAQKRCRTSDLVSGCGRVFDAAAILAAMSAVTRILSAIEQGDPHAAEQLLPLVYHELRKLAAQKLAREKPLQTLQATALVHEAYIRLVDTEKAQRWNNRGHFFAAAAEGMRRILIEQARRKQRTRHGGGFKRVELQVDDSPEFAGDEQILFL